MNDGTPGLPPELHDHLSRSARGDAVCSGWHPLLVRLQQDLTAVTTDFRFGQIKEKWGTLRCYLDYGDTASDDEMDSCDRLVTEAEDESATICEFCGEPGRVRHDLTWVKTMCENDYRAHMRVHPSAASTQSEGDSA